MLHVEWITVVTQESSGLLVTSVSSSTVLHVRGLLILVSSDTVLHVRGLLKNLPMRPTYVQVVQNNIIICTCTNFILGYSVLLFLCH